MAIRAISMDQVVDYVSDQDPAKGTDKEATEATIFKLGTLSGRQNTSIKDQATSFRPDKDSPDPKSPDMVAEFRPNQCAYLMVQFGLRGWERFLDARGNEVPFETTKKQLGGREVVCASDESMDRLGQELIRELSEQIEKLNSVEEPEPKSPEAGGPGPGAAS